AEGVRHSGSGSARKTAGFEEAARCPGFEEDIDVACMFSPPARALCTGRARGPVRNSRGWPRRLLGARRAPTRGPSPGSEVELDRSPALIHAVLNQLPRPDRVDLLHPESPHHEFQGDAVLLARSL